MSKPLLIVGAGEFALIAHQYFTWDSDYDVAGFCVERDYIREPSIEGLPVTAYEEILERWPANAHEVFVAIPASQLNRLRRRFYEELKANGYRFATYVSSRAFVWRNAEIGENTFIFENNVIQPFVKIGNDCILWSGNHVGHRTVVRDHVFVSSHVVISGYCDIGEGCFLGVNSTLNDHVVVGENVVVGSGAVITKDAEAGRIYAGSSARAVPGTTSFDVDL
jgi:sugar O-acyltransferase (sialic acid O-acetyltransferase NeuD family)